MAAEKLPFMPWYGFDYEADERCKLLTDAEDGVYRKLLWEQWKEGSVPADPTVATRLIRSDNPEIVNRILETFFLTNGTTGRKRNERLHEIRRRIEAEHAAKSKGGKKGRRKQLHTQPGLSHGSDASQPEGESGQPEPEPEPEPEERDGSRGKVPEPGTKRVKAADAADTLFERFWTAYPKRAGGNPKKAARQKWDGRIKAGVDATEIIAGAERYARYCEATQKISTEYVKQAQFWLSPTFEGWMQPWDLPATPGRPDDDAPAFADYPTFDDD